MHACLPDSMSSIYIWSDNSRPKREAKIDAMAIPTIRHLREDQVLKLNLPFCGFRKLIFAVECGGT